MMNLAEALRRGLMDTLVSLANYSPSGEIRNGNELRGRGGFDMKVAMVHYNPTYSLSQGTKSDSNRPQTLFDQQTSKLRSCKVMVANEETRRSGRRLSQMMVTEGPWPHHRSPVALVKGSPGLQSISLPSVGAYGSRADLCRRDRKGETLPHCI
jgi:hypothetical protein